MLGKYIFSSKKAIPKPVSSRMLLPGKSNIVSKGQIMANKPTIVLSTKNSIFSLPIITRAIIPQLSKHLSKFMSRDFEKNVKSLFIAQENATINKEINL